MGKKIGLYIHIPFCKKKCFYCDFVSYENVENSLVSEYFNSLQRELIFYKENYDIEIETIYIGGGTPSAVNPKHIERLIEFIYLNFKVEENCETTIEANPESLNEEKLKIYKLSNINRLSIGIQSLNDTELKALGRIHTSKRAQEILELIVRYFENFNVDLMIGLPHQNIESFSKTLERVISFGPPHLSVYSLKIEEGTYFYDEYESLKNYLPSEEEERSMYWLAVERLYDFGIYQYEISNFAKKSFECKHNLKYWDYEEYIGIGSSSHSFFEGYRYSNVSDIKEYINSVKSGYVAVDTKEYIDEEEREKEYIILGLRKIEGIDLLEFERRFNINFMKKYKTQIEKLKKYGLVDINSRFRLTKKGIDLANRVWQEFV